MQGASASCFCLCLCCCCLRGRPAPIVFRLRWQAEHGRRPSFPLLPSPHRPQRLSGLSASAPGPRAHLFPQRVSCTACDRPAFRMRAAWVRDLVNRGASCHGAPHPWHIVQPFPPAPDVNGDPLAGRAPGSNPSCMLRLPARREPLAAGCLLTGRPRGRLSASGPGPQSCGGPEKNPPPPPSRGLATLPGQNVDLPRVSV